MRHIWLFCAIICMSSIVPPLVPAFAGADEVAAERLFSTDEIDPAWFASQGLASAAPRFVSSLKEELGRFVGIEPCDDKCVAVFADGEVAFEISLDTSDRIAMILFDVPVVYAASLEEAAGHLTELPGKISLLIMRDGVAVTEVMPAEPLAVGSSFKLAVLKALDNLIGAGKLDWAQTVAFEESWRSLPTGQMKDWPVGAPVTLHTLAGLMISQSDNTATDALMDIVTRNSVETVSPRNRPFLTTREFFQLKRKTAAADREAYRSGTYDARMALLSRIGSEPLPRVADLQTDPLPEVEWFLSVEELCSLMDEVDELDIMQINPGVARKRDWSRVAFKGGSDFGVMNLTTGLVAADGAHYCVSATWNDRQALDEEHFLALYAGLLHQLKEKAAP